MRLSFLKPTVLAFVAMLAVGMTTAHCETTATAKPRKIPFHGKLQAVDTAADTITIEGKTPRVFHLTPTTKITDGSGAASTLSAATVGEDVGGSYTKDSAGTMTLFSVRFGAKTGTKTAAAAAPAAPTAPAAVTPPAEPAPAATPAPSSTPAPAGTAASKAKKQRFTGTVVSVDSAADTIVVHGKADQTFTVTSATKITGATLATLTAGEKVSGTYTKSDDGATLTLATLKATK